jgi:hypothetical protein
MAPQSERSYVKKSENFRGDGFSGVLTSGGNYGFASENRTPGGYRERQNGSPGNEFPAGFSVARWTKRAASADRNRFRTGEAALTVRAMSAPRHVRQHLRGTCDPSVATERSRKHWRSQPHWEASLNSRDVSWDIGIRPSEIWRTVRSRNRVHPDNDVRKPDLRCIARYLLLFCLCPRGVLTFRLGTQPSGGWPMGALVLKLGTEKRF